MFSGICLKEADKRNRQWERKVFKLILSSHLCKRLSDSSLLTDKSGSGVSPLSSFGVDRLRQKLCLDGEGQKKEQIVRLLSQMDQRSAVCWMDECVCCVFALSICTRLPDSIHKDSKGARPGPGNDHDYAKCPLCLSVPCGDGFGM